jgi:hypothetical protein
MAIRNANQSNSGERNTKRTKVDGKCMPNGDIPKRDILPVQSIYITGNINTNTNCRPVEISQEE